MYTPLVSQGRDGVRSGGRGEEGGVEKDREDGAGGGEEVEDREGREGRKEPGGEKSGVLTLDFSSQRHDCDGGEEWTKSDGEDRGEVGPFENERDSSVSLDVKVSPPAMWL